MTNVVPLSMVENKSHAIIIFQKTHTQERVQNYSWRTINVFFSGASPFLAHLYIYSI